MLEEARNDYVTALNVLATIKMRMVSFTTEDLMAAYLLATEWCLWLSSPNQEGSPLSGRRSKAESYAGVLEMMTDAREYLEHMLTGEMDLVEVVFQTLNPNLLARGKDLDNPEVPESSKRYYKILKCTAKFFDEQTGYNGFSKILEAC